MLVIHRRRRVRINPSPATNIPEADAVEKASEDSFPASDAPAHTPTTALGPPTGPMPEAPPEVPPEEVREHPMSDPASRSTQP